MRVRSYVCGMSVSVPVDLRASEFTELGKWDLRPTVTPGASVPTQNDKADVYMIDQGYVQQLFEEKTRFFSV